MLKRWCGNVYSTSERNYQMFNKILAKSSFVRHACWRARVYLPTWRPNTNHTTLLKNQNAINISPLNEFPLKFRIVKLCQFLASARFQLYCLEEAFVTWPLGARGPGTGLRNNTIGRRTCVSRNKMPNKKKNNAARNAFYFFMVSLKPQLERQGVVLENGMQSLAEIAGPRWKVLYLQHSFLEATLGHWNFLYFNLNFTKRVYKI